MVQLNTETVMIITPNEKEKLSFAKEILGQIRIAMEEEDACYLKNAYTGEVIEIEDIITAFWILDCLIDEQEK